MGNSSGKEDVQCVEDEQRSDEMEQINHLAALDEKQPDAIVTPAQSIQFAAAQGDVEKIRQMFEEYPDKKEFLSFINMPDNGPVLLDDKKKDDSVYKNVIITQDVPLHMAAGAGHLDVVKLLVDLEATIDAKNRIKSTPLHRAVSHNQIDIVKFLLQHGASFHERNKIGNTALHIASYLGNVEMARVLMDAGAWKQIDTPNDAELTPLHYARKAAMEHLLRNYRPGQPYEFKSGGQSSAFSVQPTLKVDDIKTNDTVNDSDLSASRSLASVSDVIALEAPNSQHRGSRDSEEGRDVSYWSDE